MTHEKQRSIPFTYKLIIGILVFAVMFIVSMTMGAADISFKDVWQALFTNGEGEKISIIREIRLPREVAAIVVGAALAVAGAIMQGMTRNPLADPGLLGLLAAANCFSRRSCLCIPLCHCRRSWNLL
jgi:iron complex transport system permease protein